MQPAAVHQELGGEFLVHDQPFIDRCAQVFLGYAWCQAAQIPFVDGPSARLFVQERALDGADGFTFEEFGVGSDTEGFQQACLHLP